MRKTRKKSSKKTDPLVVAIGRLNACYEMAKKSEDATAAIAAQRELNRLLGLHGSEAPDNEDEGASDRELIAVRAHLSPLGLADPGASVVELARLAVQKIVELSSGGENRKL